MANISVQCGAPDLPPDRTAHRPSWTCSAARLAWSSQIRRGDGSLVALRRRLSPALPSAAALGGPAVLRSSNRPASRRPIFVRLLFLVQDDDWRRTLVAGLVH